jgi:hypothetical protein
MNSVTAPMASHNTANHAATLKVAQWGGAEGMFAAAVAEGNADLAKGVCRAAVAMGEGHIKMLLATTDAGERQHVQALLQLLVECTLIGFAQSFAIH